MLILIELLYEFINLLKFIICLVLRFLFGNCLPLYGFIRKVYYLVFSFWKLFFKIRCCERVKNKTFISSAEFTVNLSIPYIWIVFVKIFQ